MKTTISSLTETLFWIILDGKIIEEFLNMHAFSFGIKFWIRAYFLSKWKYWSKFQIEPFPCKNKIVQRPELKFAISQAYFDANINAERELYTLDGANYVRTVDEADLTLGFTDDGE